MNYRLLNYFLIINSDYILPDANSTLVIKNFIDKFNDQSFFPRIQESQTFQFQMNGTQPKSIMQKTMGLVSFDNRWFINFLPNQIEIAYNSDLENSDILSDEFLSKSEDYLNLIKSLIDINSLIRVGFVLNFFSEGINPEYNKEKFSTDLSDDSIVEIQHNSVKRKKIENIDFNIVETIGYLKEAEIKYIKGTKRFEGNILKLDINTVVSETNILDFNIIDTIKNKIIPGVCKDAI